MQSSQESSEPNSCERLQLRSQSDRNTTLPAGHWRIVGAWTPLRRKSEAIHRGNGTENGNESLMSLRPVSQPPENIVGLPPRHESHRKRVSLFLRRQRSAQTLCGGGKESALSAETSAASTTSQNIILTRSGEDRYSNITNRLVRRARSACLPPSKNLADSFYNGNIVFESDHNKVDNENSNNEKCDGSLYENKYLASGASNNGEDEEDEIIGEICLEKFADGDGDDDYAFLDTDTVDLCSSDGRPGLQVHADGLRWVGDEHDFAALFAEVGFDELLDDNGANYVDGIGYEEKQEFQVDDTVANEWRAAAEEHNRRCGAWGSISHITPSPIDIRELALEFPHVYTLP